MEPTEQKVHLLIADISGFTRFIWAHRETLAHAQVIVNELLRAVIEPVHLHFPDRPFELQKCLQRSWGYRFRREWVKYFRSLPCRLGLQRVTLPPDDVDSMNGTPA